MNKLNEKGKKKPNQLKIKLKKLKIKKIKNEQFNTKRKRQKAFAGLSKKKTKNRK